MIIHHNQPICRRHSIEIDVEKNPGHSIVPCKVDPARLAVGVKIEFAFRALACLQAAVSEKFECVQ